MLDDYGRRDLNMGVIVGLMDGHLPPRQYTVDWVLYYDELSERVTEQFGPGAWDSVQLLAGFAAPEFCVYDGFRATLHFNRAEALSLIKANDPEHYDAWAASLADDDTDD